jgi:hypothetical protein
MGRNVGWTGICSKRGHVGQEVVDADRPGALEGVVGGHDAKIALEPVEVLDQGVDHIELYCVLDDGVALFLDCPQEAIGGVVRCSCSSCFVSCSLWWDGAANEATGVPVRVAHVCVARS